jgi:serine/threonine-protein kinase
LDGASARYTCQISNAVDHAHRQGVLHRDLRPSNVLGGQRHAQGRRLRHVTRRFAAHGTTVIGSLTWRLSVPRRAGSPDIYSLGVTMYQMMTGVLPHHAVAGRPRSPDEGRAAHAPRLKNPKIPKSINDIVLKAMAPDISARYHRAGELLDDVLAARSTSSRRRPRTASSTLADPAEPSVGDSIAQDIHLRLKAREAPQPRFCWHCRKPLHARSDRCPFCGEGQ